MFSFIFALISFAPYLVSSQSNPIAGSICTNLASSKFCSHMISAIPLPQGLSIDTVDTQIQALLQNNSASTSVCSDNSQMSDMAYAVDFACSMQVIAFKRMLPTNTCSDSNPSDYSICQSDCNWFFNQVKQDCPKAFEGFYGFMASYIDNQICTYFPTDNCASGMSQYGSLTNKEIANNSATVGFKAIDGKIGALFISLMSVLIF